MDTKRNPLLDSGLLLAAATAFLYCASAAHTGGFNSRLGLDGDVLDRNFQQILYDGFLISFGPAILVLIIYTALRFFYSDAVLPGISDALRKSWRRKRFVLKLKHRWYGKRKDSELEIREKRHTRVAAAITGVALAIILSLVYFESKGKEVGSQVRIKLESKSFREHETVTVTVNGEVRKLVYLSCGARNCAGIDPETRVVQYFPQNGHSYLLQDVKPKQSQANGNVTK
ncbi:hypothetical protein [Denitromonas iodatirespirans]|uniref:Uncharacterized protein n=1 Tax=Denitromonas iodatirespirans TaxID=2795389 RepID=A0A944HFV9_DENI1|nr:hypothetical protein [Denitromonas iodatirespirans]MBT0964061.1 hypothetical protein [Denitromonas iodatirespirans]